MQTQLIFISPLIYLPRPLNFKLILASRHDYIKFFIADSAADKVIYYSRVINL